MKSDIRNPQKISSCEKHFDKNAKMIIVPRDDFVRVGGIAIYQDNSTRMFGKDKREKLLSENYVPTLVNRIQKEARQN